MRKIKLLTTYLFAILCILFSLLHRTDIDVLKTISNDQENLIMIYMFDDDNELIPVSIHYNKSDSDKENIQHIFQLMKQPMDILDFKPVIPASIQCLNVEIVQNIVKLDLNEAFYTMNSKHELSFIESIVGSIVHLNQNYIIEFYVNHEKVNEMPLSGLTMNYFDKNLGMNNFSLKEAMIHLSTSKQIVKKKQKNERSYYVINSLRISSNTDLLTFINDTLHETSSLLECEKIEFVDDQLWLHLNQAFMIDERVVDHNKIECLLYTLKLNDIGDKFVLKFEDETVIMSDYSNTLIHFEDLNLNIFEQ
ncbi:MAG: GerMN domain-containing protein [Traorella sp.]